MAKKTQPNYYDILEVDSMADLETIRNSFRLLAKKYHPDTCDLLPKNEAEQRFILINEAYDVLSDKTKRELYDSSFLGSPSSSSVLSNNSNSEEVGYKSRNQSSKQGGFSSNFEAANNNYRKYNYTPNKNLQMLEKFRFISKIAGVFALILGLLISGIVIDKSFHNKKGNKTSEVSNSVENAKNDFFKIGSSKSRVIEVMGSPESKSIFEYKYGNSFIYFDKKGNVKGWRNVNNKLKVSLGNPIKSAPKVKIGSSQKDVINAFGTPRVISGLIWKYENITIKFDKKGRVIKILS